MQTWIWIVIIVIVALIVALLTWWITWSVAKPTESSTNNNFAGDAKNVASSTQQPIESDSAVPSGDKMILFFMEGCGHCKKMMPDWQKFVASSTNKIPKVMINGPKCSTTSKQYAVNGYPSIVLDRKGKSPVMYKGDRSAADLSRWLSEQLKQ